MLPAEDRALLNNALEGMQVDPATIADVMAMLDSRAESLDTASDLARVPAGWFGDSWTGGTRLAKNADMAHDAAVAELQNMVLGLRAYADEIKAYRDDVVGVEEGVTAQLRAVQNTADCTTVPTIGAGQCSAPTTGDDR